MPAPHAEYAPGTMTPATRRAGPLPPVLGRVFAPLYAAAIARRNRLFDAGRGVVTLDRPVISVGNLSVGGTGKSPMVAYLLRRLIDLGRVPCVAMRGYAPRGGASDEAMDYRAMFPTMPIVAQPDRVLGLLELFATSEGGAVDVVVLDDGFQHRRLARNLDLVMIDATRPPWEDAMLPLGWLREPVGSLARAGVVVFSHADRVSGSVRRELVARAASQAPRAVVTLTRHAWTSVAVHEGSTVREASPSILAGVRAYVVCAIGNPGPFVESVKAHGAEVVGTKILRDHDPYSAETVARLRGEVTRSRAGVMLTTGKDWTKLGPRVVEGWPNPVVVPRLGLEFLEGEAGVLGSVREALTMS